MASSRADSSLLLAHALVRLPALVRALRKTIILRRRPQDRPTTSLKPLPRRARMRRWHHYRCRMDRSRRALQVYLNDLRQASLCTAERHKVKHRRSRAALLPLQVTPRLKRLVNRRNNSSNSSRLTRRRRRQPSSNRPGLRPSLRPRSPRVAVRKSRDHLKSARSARPLVHPHLHPEIPRRRPPLLLCLLLRRRLLPHPLLHLQEALPALRRWRVLPVRPA
ncbi:hypothetical protein C8Q70DRAFT_945849 [Cubamyces menziesii]|nr:hypothetical protein C8Q70DRAFT_945849 [Cubamyces menziesii]